MARHESQITHSFLPEAVTLLAETHPLVARFVEIGTGIVMGQIPLVRRRLGGVIC